MESKSFFLFHPFKNLSRIIIEISLNKRFIFPEYIFKKIIPAHAFLSTCKTRLTIIIFVAPKNIVKIKQDDQKILTCLNRYFGNKYSIEIVYKIKNLNIP